MSSKQRRRLFAGIAIIAILFASVIASYAASIKHYYDDLNRLIRVEYENGDVLVYSYDEVGNRTQKSIQVDSTPPVSAAPDDGYFSGPQTVTLTCSDGTGAGCDKIYYTTDGTTPTTASLVYSSPIEIAATTTIRFFSTDKAGNAEAEQSRTYAILTPPPSGAIRIASAPSTYYASLQAAYNAAGAGNVIQVKATSFIDSLNVNRDISVNLEGGYSDDFSSITGMTGVKGMIQTQSGGRQSFRGGRGFDCEREAGSGDGESGNEDFHSVL